MSQDRKAREFGKGLDALRMKKGIGVNQLAAKAGVSGPYMSLLLRGKHGPPSPEVVMALSEVLGVSRYELLSTAGHLDPDLQQSCIDAQRLYGRTFMSTSGKENRQGKSKFVLMVDLDVLSTASDNDQFSKYRRGIVTATKKQLKCQQDEVLLQLGRLLEELGRALPGDAEATNDPEGR